MLRPRVIPCLLILNGGLVKTVSFTDPRYVGDPVNAVRIFNEKEVDELMVVDIGASSNGVEPDYRLISYIASECRMPLCYGGGVRDLAHIERIIGLGVEKVAVSSAAVANPQLVAEAARRVGSQSVTVVIDAKKTGLLRRYEVVTHRGRRRTGLNPVEFARLMERCGAGEIVINSVDNDGEMRGYDLELVRQIRQEVHLPMTALGGAGSFDDLQELINRFGIIGAAAGSLFVFKGRYRAVLINYPSQKEKDVLCRTPNEHRSY